ncbi:MAG: hypothetical protein WCR75_10875 [Sphaerochaetaceae bacterium]
MKMKMGKTSIFSIKLTMLLLVFLLTLSDIGAFSGDWWLLQLESNLDFNFVSAIDRTERLTDGEYIAGFNNKPLFQIDLELYQGHWTFLTEGSIFSLRPPIVIDTLSIFTPMVKLAYLEYDDQFFSVSIGRRKQSIGISDNNLFVNRDMPFFDGITVSVGKDTGFRFDSLVSVSNLNQIQSKKKAYESISPLWRWDADTGTYVQIPTPLYDRYSKFFVYHALSYVGKNWYVMIGESGILANPNTVGDLSIFSNLHNENSDRANVGMEFQIATTAIDKLFLYLMAAMDDLPSQKGHQTPRMLAITPSALAIGGGFRWNPIEGKTYEYPTHDADKGIRRNTDFGSMNGGLIFSFDYVATSRWMYVRTNQHDSSITYFNGFQSFYNYFFNPWFISNPDYYSVPFGLKYGGDSQLLALKGSYETHDVKINGSFELLLQGREGRERSVDINYWGSADLSEDPDDWMYSGTWISSGDIKPKLMVQLSAEKGLMKWLSIYTGVSLVFSTYLPFSYTANIGATISL